eukprot:s1546_g6.t1
MLFLVDRYCSSFLSQALCRKWLDICGIMALRLLGHENIYVTPQDIYNLRLLVHCLQETTWAPLVLPFIGMQIFHNGSCSASRSSTVAISENGQLARFGGGASPPDLGPVVAVAVAAFHTCALKASGKLVCFGYNQVGVSAMCLPTSASGKLVCFGYNKYGQCDVPPDLGPVVAVAVAAYHTCALKASGKMVCFGYNKYGQCDVPPDLGPVVSVAAGEHHTCAVKTSGELICFGLNDCGQCDVPPGFRVRHAAPQTIHAPTTDPTQEVLQPVHHSEPPAEISREEGAAIVAEQEASWIEHNIGSGWHGTDLQSQAPVGFTRVVHMTVRNFHEKLNEVLEQSTALHPYRQALHDEGLDWLQLSGAKIFMEPWCFRAIRSHLSTMRLRPCDIFVAEDLEEEVRRVLRQIPRSLGVVPRRSRNIAFADEDEEVVLVSRSFLNIPATRLANPASVAQSTTEARTHQGYHGTNPRRVQAQIQMSHASSQACPADMFCMLVDEAILEAFPLYSCCLP